MEKHLSDDEKSILGSLEDAKIVSVDKSLGDSIKYGVVDSEIVGYVAEVTVLYRLYR